MTNMGKCNNLSRAKSCSSLGESTPMTRISCWLKAVSRSAPLEWRCAILNVAKASDILNELRNRSSHASRGFFFGFLDMELARVSLIICRSAKRISAGSRKGGGCFYGIVRVGNGNLPTPALAANMYRHAKWCRYIAAVNRAALGMILDVYETVTGKGGGREYLARCLGAGSYIGAHMTSPVMVELKASVAHLVDVMPPGSAMSMKGMPRQLDEEKDLPPSVKEHLHRALRDDPPHDTDMKCPICLDVMYKPAGLPCGHTFCAQCLIRSCGVSSTFYAPLVDEQLQRLGDDSKRSCPVCRYPEDWELADSEWKAQEKKFFTAQMAADSRRASQKNKAWSNERAGIRGVSSSPIELLYELLHEC